MSELTQDIVMRILTVIPPSPKYIGLAMSPKDYEHYLREIRNQTVPTLNSAFTYRWQVICDPRLKGDKIEAFTDAEAWKARVKEQNIHEAWMALSRGDRGLLIEEELAARKLIKVTTISPGVADVKVLDADGISAAMDEPDFIERCLARISSPASQEHHPEPRQSP